MNQERLMQVLLAPLVSEKSTRIAEKKQVALRVPKDKDAIKHKIKTYITETNQQVAFRVTKDATKPEIQAAVELLFGAKVAGVSTLNVKGKLKRNGRRNNWKKAYVVLVEGQDIDFTAVSAE